MKSPFKKMVKNEFHSDIYKFIKQRSKSPLTTQKTPLKLQVQQAEETSNLDTQFNSQKQAIDFSLEQRKLQLKEMRQLKEDLKQEIKQTAQQIKQLRASHSHERVPEKEKIKQSARISDQISDWQFKVDQQLKELQLQIAQKEILDDTQFSQRKQPEPKRAEGLNKLELQKILDNFMAKEKNHIKQYCGQYMQTFTNDIQAMVKAEVYKCQEEFKKSQQTKMKKQDSSQLGLETKDEVQKLLHIQEEKVRLLIEEVAQALKSELETVKLSSPLAEFQQKLLSFELQLSQFQDSLAHLPEHSSTQNQLQEQAQFISQNLEQVSAEQPAQFSLDILGDYYRKEEINEKLQEILASLKREDASLPLQERQEVSQGAITEDQVKNLIEKSEFQRNNELNGKFEQIDQKFSLLAAQLNESLQKVQLNPVPSGIDAQSKEEILKLVQNSKEQIELQFETKFKALDEQISQQRTPGEPQTQPQQELAPQQKENDHEINLRDYINKEDFQEFQNKILGDLGELKARLELLAKKQDVQPSEELEQKQALALDFIEVQRKINEDLTERIEKLETEGEQAQMIMSNPPQAQGQQQGESRQGQQVDELQGERMDDRGNEESVSGAIKQFADEVNQSLELIREEIQQLQSKCVKYESQIVVIFTIAEEKQLLEQKLSQVEESLIMFESKFASVEDKLCNQRQIESKFQQLNQRIDQLHEASLKQIELGKEENPDSLRQIQQILKPSDVVLGEQFLNENDLIQSLGAQMEEHLRGFIKLAEDGNSLYAAIVYQYLQFQICQANHQGFQQFLDLIQISNFNISPGQHSAASQQGLRGQFYNYCENIRAAENAQQALLQLMFNNQETFYSLAIIFMKNLITYFYQKDEEAQTFCKQSELDFEAIILEWKKECPLKDLVLKLISNHLELYIVVYSQPEVNLEILTIGQNANQQVTLINQGGVYHIGLKK